MLRLALQIALGQGCGVLLVVMAGVNSGLHGPEYATEWFEFLVGFIPQVCNFVGRSMSRLGMG